MPDFSHDPAEDGFHEIQLSGKQLVFLFMTATIVLVFTFLCGVLVGRDASTARLGAVSAQAATLPAETEAIVDRAPFEPPAPAEGPDTAARPDDTLTYHDTLQGNAPRPGLRAPAETPPSGDATPAVDTKPAPETKPDPGTAGKPVPPRSQRTEPVISGVPTSGRPGALVVQVVALHDAAAAAALVKRLTAKGYPAFLSSTSSATAQTTYRVQVGRYDDRRQAEDVKRRLEKEEQFKPWVTSR